MRTETQITLIIKTFYASENLFPDPSGFHLKIFLSASSVESKFFKVNGPEIHLNQTLKIKNITGKILEIWLCTRSNKIIAAGTLQLEDGEQQIELYMLQTEFGKLHTSLQVKRYQIEKEEYIEPDEELLKKEQDPEQVSRKKEEQERKAREQAKAIQNAKLQKKPTVTLTRFNKKQQPYV